MLRIMVLGSRGSTQVGYIHTTHTQHEKREDDGSKITFDQVDHQRDRKERKRNVIDNPRDSGTGADAADVRVLYSHHSGPFPPHFYAISFCVAFPFGTCTHYYAFLTTLTCICLWSNSDNSHVKLLLIYHMYRPPAYHRSQMWVYHHAHSSPPLVYMHVRIASHITRRIAHANDNVSHL